MKGLHETQGNSRGTRYDGRTEQIERVHPGDKLIIIREPDNRYNVNNFTITTEKGHNVGQVPAELCNVLAPIYDSDELDIISAIASFVEPITQRNRYAKQAVLFVELRAKISGTENNRKFDQLTWFLPILEDDRFGHWGNPPAKDGILHMPYPVYTDAVKKLIQAIYDFIEEHPEYNLRNYLEIMNEYGLSGKTNINTEVLDEKATLALLVGIIRQERFCDGLILSNLKEGMVQNLLLRLKQIDDQHCV